MKMASTHSSLRWSQFIFILLWSIHRTHTISIKSIEDQVPFTARRPAFNDRDLRSVYLSETQQRNGDTSNIPLDSILQYLQKILVARNSYYSIYNELGYDLQHRLRSIVHEMTNLGRFNSKRFRQKQRKTKKLGKLTAVSSGIDDMERALPTAYEHPRLDVDEPNSFSRQFANNENPPPHLQVPFPIEKLPFHQQPPEYLPSDLLPHHHLPQTLLERTPASIPISEPTGEDIFSSPTFMFPGLPPQAMIVQVQDNDFKESYEIAPSPNYSTMDLLGDLMSWHTHALDIRVNKANSCYYIDTIDRLGQVDASYEWRIQIKNQDDEEIWNSQCLPPDTFKLLFGYGIFFTFEMRYGLPERQTLIAQETLDQVHDEISEDRLR